MDKVLITGMSGRIGSAVGRQLEGKYELSALNRRLVPGVPTCQADIADMEAIRPAFEGIDAVVHMAGGFESEGLERLLQSNINGAYNIFECAYQAGVKRVIYASSGRVISNYELDEPYKSIVEGRYDDVPPGWQRITHEDPVRPHSIYACTKLWGEALARYYAESFGMSSIVIRVGYVNDEDKPDTKRRFTHWASQRDSAQMVEKCLAAPDDLKFAIFFLTSDNKWGYRDLDYPRKLIGYEPEDRAEDYRALLPKE